MCSESAKPAALQRLWRILTRTGWNAGLRHTAVFTTRRSNGAGCNGAKTTAGPPFPINTATPITEILTRDRLKARALLQFNRDLQAVERYVRLHQRLNKGRCSDA